MSLTVVPASGPCAMSALRAVLAGNAAGRVSMRDFYANAATGFALGVVATNVGAPLALARFRGQAAPLETPVVLLRPASGANVQWAVPPTIGNVRVVVAGAGGGGAGTPALNALTAGSGGGAGGLALSASAAVGAGTLLEAALGAGGDAGAALPGGTGGAGGATIVSFAGGALRANGGEGGSTVRDVTSNGGGWAVAAGVTGLAGGSGGKTVTNGAEYFNYDLAGGSGGALAGTDGAGFFGPATVMDTLRGASGAWAMGGYYDGIVVGDFSVTTALKRAGLPAYFSYEPGLTAAMLGGIGGGQGTDLTAPPYHGGNALAVGGGGGSAAYNGGRGGDGFMGGGGGGAAGGGGDGYFGGRGGDGWAMVLATRRPDTATALAVSPAVGGSTALDLAAGNVTAFAPGTQYTLTVAAPTRVRLHLWGAGGGSGTYGTTTVAGGNGGYAAANLRLLPGTTYTLAVGTGGGRPGTAPATGGSGGWPGGGFGTAGDASGAGGGGYSGFFAGTGLAHASALLVAGGGGGATGWVSGEYGGYPGNGGGALGGNSSPATSYAMGGTQAAGGGPGIGASGASGAAGGPLQGGNGDSIGMRVFVIDTDGGGGGGGYYGGQGGQSDGRPGAGGSGYAHAAMTSGALLLGGSHVQAAPVPPQAALLPNVSVAYGGTAARANGWPGFAILELADASLLYPKPTTWTFITSTGPYSGTSVPTQANMSDGLFTMASGWGNTGNPPIPFITADFGAVVFVATVFTAPLPASGGWGPSYLSNRAIGVSNDNVTFTTVGTTGTVVDGAITQVTVRRSCRYIRIGGFANESSWLGVSELYFS